MTTTDPARRVLIEEVATILKEAGQAHHQAYLATDGDDPEWGLWYGRYLQPKLSPLLQTELTQSELIYWMIHLDKLYRAEPTEEPWPVYYARILVTHYTPTVSTATSNP